jgi:Protein of unknown function (DUF3592)
MIVTKVLSVVLAFAGVAFAVLAAFVSVQFTTSHCSWPRAEAVVYEIDARSVDDNKYGFVVVTLRYRSGLVDRYAEATRSLWRSRGEGFARDYAVGTRHTVRIDPSGFRAAELEDWNLEKMLILLFLCIFSACLLIAARYYWRFR